MYGEERVWMEHGLQICTGTGVAALLPPARHTGVSLQELVWQFIDPNLCITLNVIYNVIYNDIKYILEFARI